LEVFLVFLFFSQCPECKCNFYVVCIVVCIAGYGGERKQEYTTGRIIELIQNARKLSSQTYRKSKNISDLEAKTLAKQAVPASVPDENFCDVLSNLENKMASLSEAVEKFSPQVYE
jgi:hypothetical protein